MSFFLETTDMDLGDTPIENIFINDYMPMANGTYVKVYLLAFKYAYDRDYKIDLNNKTIAKHLNIPQEDVLGAWDFWESKGIIEKIPIDDRNSIDYKVKFLNLKQLYIKNNIQLFESKKEPEQPIKDRTEDFIKANKIPEINNMFNNIDNIMRRQTVPMEKQRIYDWVIDYNMNSDVIEKAFSYGVEKKGVRNINYVEGIVRNWYDQGLTNMETLMEYFKNKDEKYYLYQKIMRSLGLDKRPIRDEETSLIDKWFEEYEFDLDLVLEACQADKNPIPSIKYVNGILKSWHKKGIKNVEDIEVLDKPPEKLERFRKTKGRRPKAATTRFHNFEQRTDKYSSDDLEKMAKKKRESYNQRSKGEL